MDAHIYPYIYSIYYSESNLECNVDRNLRFREAQNCARVAIATRENQSGHFECPGAPRKAPAVFPRDLARKVLSSVLLALEEAEQPS